ncbi:hypothetical protein P8452_65940 [Trifolium repens]|nr:hypothetical protein P8452_65940 [Trifolium repens]
MAAQITTDKPSVVILWPCLSQSSKDSALPKTSTPPQQLQPTEKVYDVIPVEVSSSKHYSQVNHDQDRLEADRNLEKEINNVSDSLHSPVGESLANTPVMEPVRQPVIVVENTPEKSPGISSSTQSEFVDNSQVPSLTIVEKQKTADVEQPVLLVQQDIQFLKESWANLADIEDQTMLQVPPLLLDKPPDIPALDVNKHADNLSPSNTENDGFQLVTTRKKFDKAKASKPPIHKASHITRSKVGSPKPSK